MREGGRQQERRRIDGWKNMHMARGVATQLGRGKQMLQDDVPNHRLEIAEDRAER